MTGDLVVPSWVASGLLALVAVGTMAITLGADRLFQGCGVLIGLAAGVAFGYREWRQRRNFLKKKLTPRV